MRPAAQKFLLLIFRSMAFNSVSLSGPSAPGLIEGNRHMAAANQKAADPDAAIMAAISMYGFMVVPRRYCHYGMIAMQGPVHKGARAYACHVRVEHSPRRLMITA